MTRMYDAELTQTAPLPVFSPLRFLLRDIKGMLQQTLILKGFQGTLLLFTLDLLGPAVRWLEKMLMNSMGSKPSKKNTRKELTNRSKSDKAETCVFFRKATNKKMERWLMTP